MTTPKVLDNLELKQWWDDWTPMWEQHYEQMTLPVTQTLLTWTQVRNASSILEVACGSGAGTRLCNFQKAGTATLTSIDISANMVERTKQKLNDPSVLVASSEALPFEDGAFDRYYASYCLHLTTDPDKMLKEASRVLKKGGIAAFSMWGRRENCLQLTYIEPIKMTIVQLNMTPGEPKRSPFHLGNDEAQLRQRAMDAGFEKCVTFYQLQPTPYADGELITKIVLAPPTTQQVLATLPTDKVKELKEKAAQAINEMVHNGKPVSMEALILVAYK